MRFELQDTQLVLENSLVWGKNHIGIGDRILHLWHTKTEISLCPELQKLNFVWFCIVHSISEGEVLWPGLVFSAFVKYKHVLQPLSEPQPEFNSDRMCVTQEARLPDGAALRRTLTAPRELQHQSSSWKEAST